MNITPAARITPNGSELSWNISWNWPMCDATAIAARKPTNIAAPPSVGVGRVCTCRASPEGATTAPRRIASMRTTGVERERDRQRNPEHDPIAEPRVTTGPGRG